METTAHTVTNPDGCLYLGVDWHCPNDTKDKNRRNQTDRHVDECFFCGRGLTESGVKNGLSVHLRTDGRLFPWADQDAWHSEDSQGSFPIGSECAKRLPAAFRGR